MRVRRLAVLARFSRSAFLPIRRTSLFRLTKLKYINLDPSGSKFRRCKMAKCSICGKGVTFGHNVSHSNRKTNRTWKPNIRRVKAVVNGTNQTVYVCSRCLRSGKIERA